MVWWKIIIETGFAVSMFVNAMLFVPQAIKVYRAKKAEELSLTTFLGFNIIQIFAVLHGVIVHDWILTIGFLVSFITCAMVTVQIWWYGR